MACEAFVDCESINISGNAQGLFTISFDYYSTEDTIDTTNGVSIEINNLDFTGYLLSHQIRKLSNIPPSASCKYWIHSLQVTATTPR